MTADRPFESPELVDLFTTYTASPDSIGSDLGRTMGRATADAPLLVATGADLALYPGRGAAPSVLGLRMSTRGFKELAGISHLGPALATLAALKEAEPDGVWQADARRLLPAVHRAQAANSPGLWRDVISVDAYAGRETAIADMTDYALTVTANYLERIIADPGHLSFTTLRAEYLDDSDRQDLPVSFNRIMVGTFYLIGLDISHRLIGWLDQQGIDWTRAMVIVAGKQGRVTAGVTRRTNSVAGMILAASRGALSPDRLYIAPHAPAFATPVDGDLTEVARLEPVMRALWAGTRTVIQLGARMFPAVPAFSPEPDGAGTIAASAGPGPGGTVSDLPEIAGGDDWLAMITRLRVVMEDPRQLLSGAVTDFAAQNLVAAGNDPAKVFVPGLDGEPYPRKFRDAT
jgi:Domain of unknown function (DUF5624)